MTESVIKTESLRKVYGSLFLRKKTVALDNLSIEIPQGTVYGFLGPNGAGKTTTIKLLMDLLRPTSGSATVMGRPTWDVSVKREIGFLPDTPSFPAQMGAQEFLSVCAKLLEMNAGERRKRIAEVLEIVQMSTHAQEKLGSFSRGMLQRIGIAQAILNNPRLLILDEPLLGLDPYGRQDLKRIILDQNARGTTVFFSSHILSDVQEICNHVAILNKGRLICNGSLAELLRTDGLCLTIRNCDEAMLALVEDADESTKAANATWTLLFHKTSPDLLKKIENVKKAHPDAIEEKELKESLEQFFFNAIGTPSDSSESREGGSK